MAVFRKKRGKEVLGIIYIRSEDLQYLLLHRKYPWIGWGFLKGGCEFDSERFTLKKEMREETSLIEGRDYEGKNIQRISDLRVNYSFLRQKGRDSRRFVQNLQAFAVEVYPGVKVKVDNIENDDYCWKPLKKAQEMLKHEQNKTALEQANEFIRKQIEGSLQTL